jgi:hypothetical protein
MAFWAHIDQLKLAYPHHRQQLFVYQEALDMDGKILYISRDDLCLEEVDIPKDDAQLRAIMMKDIGEMTEFFEAKKLPPREPDVIFDELKKEWKTNWKIERSPYLTKITGFKDRDEWSSYADKQVRKLNREVKNTAILEAFKKEYPKEFKAVIAKFKAEKEAQDGNE